MAAGGRRRRRRRLAAAQAWHASSRRLPACHRAASSKAALTMATAVACGRRRVNATWHGSVWGRASRLTVVGRNRWIWECWHSHPRRGGVRPHAASRRDGDDQRPRSLQLLLHPHLEAHWREGRSLQAAQALAASDRFYAADGAVGPAGRPPAAHHRPAELQGPADQVRRACPLPAAAAAAAARSAGLPATCLRRSGRPRLGRAPVQV